MPLSCIEIRRRATAFAKEWVDAADEDAEAKSFWGGFFQVFDVSRKRVAIFEHSMILRKCDGLADSYDPPTMPPDQDEGRAKAHERLDKAVDKCYCAQPFQRDAKRVEYLVELYEKYTQGLLTGEKRGRAKWEDAMSAKRLTSCFPHVNCLPQECN